MNSPVYWRHCPLDSSIVHDSESYGGCVVIKGYFAARSSTCSLFAK